MTARPELPVHWTAVILAGGRSTRLGFDKSRATVGGRTLLGALIDDIPADVPIVVVGPESTEVPRAVAWATEPRRFGGPVSGLACGLEMTSTPWVAVLAVDMPAAGRVATALAASARDVPPQADALVPCDESGIRQPLAALYRVEALRRAISEAGLVFGLSMCAVTDRLNVTESSDDDVVRDLRDIDTPEDLAAARRSVSSRTAHVPTAGRPSSMDAWVEAAAKALELDASVDVDRILDVAREAAHGVARPMAPVSTYLLGQAVAGGMTVEEAARRLTELAQGWTPDATADPPLA
ncbi:MAG: molybdenum cofactor guanylyltransferase [Actinobacteria bacterium]|nr:molybdenum cofactor guanylyltransferase [Actinomycetota bacterium]